MQKSGAMPERVPKRLLRRLSRVPPAGLSPRGHRGGKHGNKNHLPSLPGIVLTQTSLPPQPNRHGGIQALGSRCRPVTCRATLSPRIHRGLTAQMPSSARLNRASRVLKLVPITLVQNPPSPRNCLMNKIVGTTIRWFM